MYLLRLDDASEHMNLKNWLRMVQLLDKYGIKPIYGIIPHNEDSELLQYEYVENFWVLMKEWEEKGWTPAMHGYSHVFETNKGGINPVNHRSEFAGVPLEQQKQKIRDGLRILNHNGIDPSIFFAPAHTFDINTIKALQSESNIRTISDTVANDVYITNGFCFIPQQSGKVRNLPFRTVTFCYHPNNMSDAMYDELEKFLTVNKQKFGTYYEAVHGDKHGKTLFDVTLQSMFNLKHLSN